MKNKYNVGDFVLFEIYEKKVGIIKEIYKTTDNKTEYLLFICGPTNSMRPEVWVRQREIKEILYQNKQEKETNEIQ